MENLNLITNIASAIILMFFAIKYFFAKEFMPYHSTITSKKWENIESKTQRLLLSLMKSMAVGVFSFSFLVIGLSIKYLFLSNNLGELITKLSVVIVFLGLFYTTYWTQLGSKAKTPWKLILILFLINAIFLIVQTYFFI